jgi:hypothetical protein
MVPRTRAAAAALAGTGNTATGVPDAGPFSPVL